MNPVIRSIAGEMMAGELFDLIVTDMRSISEQRFGREQPARAFTINAIYFCACCLCFRRSFATPTSCTENKTKAHERALQWNLQCGVSASWAWHILDMSLSLGCWVWS